MSRDMTDSEAISNLNHIYGFLSPNIQRSLDVAFKALEETPQGKWIPVSERLPSHNEYIKNNGLFNVSDGNRSYSEWFDIYDKQGFGEPTMAGFCVDYAVTAWQPLPEPYKEGGE